MKELKEKIDAVNDYTNMNSEWLRNFRLNAPYFDMNNPESKEIILLAQSKGLI